MASNARATDRRLHLRPLGQAARGGVAWAVALLVAVWAHYDFDALYRGPYAAGSH